MIQEVKFQGLSHSPSDYDCQDGELATCLNLINEDGALKPIATPVVAESNITIPDGASIKFVHKVAHKGNIHSHYIIEEESGWYWVEKEGDGTTHTLDIGDAEINNVCAIGNILCFINDRSTVYAYWKDGVYKIFNYSDFDFSVRLYGSDTTSDKTYKGTLTVEEMKRSFVNTNSTDSDAVYFTRTNAEGTSTVFYAVDTKANLELESLGRSWFKYTVFGIAALKLYDGSYVKTSSLFSIGSGTTPDKLTFDMNTGGDKIPTIEGTLSFFKMSAMANVNNSSIYDLIEGVDIFLTECVPEVALDKEYEIDEYGTDPGYTGQAGNVTINKCSTTEMAKKLDDLVFYKVLSIKKGDFYTYKDLTRPYKTEETLALASSPNISFGGKVSYCYNNRLHLCNTTKQLARMIIVTANEAFDPDPTYYDCIVKIENYGNNIGTIYHKTTFPIRCNRVISIPLTNISATFYIKVNSNTYYCYKPSFVTSENNNLSLCFSSKNYVDKESFEEITQSIWETMYNNYTNNKDVGFDRQRNIVKVSEAENPFVFPAKNTVQVGTSSIKALSSNTRPISEGQFGEAPLYAFTDEGVWMLMTGSEGTYDARQPVSRDICNNTDGILQIDDAVLFPTEHGIIMQQGRESSCITEQLDDYPFDYMQLYKYDYSKKVLIVNNTTENKVKYVRFRKFLYSDNGSSAAKMIYDYYDNRIILFNPDYEYAYVYSLKSKLWGTMENVFKDKIDIYPEPYAINKSGNIVNVHVEDPTDDQTYFLCSRPLTLGEKDIYKTLFTCITRGYLQGSEKGKCGMVLYGSNDLFHWFPIKTSVNKYLRGMAGSPYKYFRIAIIGSLSPDESISGLSVEFQERWQNQLR